MLPRDQALILPIDCEGGGERTVYIGKNTETQKIIPTAREDITVKVPPGFEGDRPILLVRIGSALGLEPRYDAWVRYFYEVK